MLKRFMDKVAKTDTCWIWVGARNPNGYGAFGVNGKTRLAHMVSYEMFNGELSPELVVMHSCDNPACVNPAHLKLGTQSENRIDCLNKGRGNVAKGEEKPTTKLTEEIVTEIRTSTETSTYFISKYGIKQQTVSDIRCRRTWKHIP